MGLLALIFLGGSTAALGMTLAATERSTTEVWAEAARTRSEKDRQAQEHLHHGKKRDKLGRQQQAVMYDNCMQVINDNWSNEDPLAREIWSSRPSAGSTKWILH